MASRDGGARRLLARIEYERCRTFGHAWSDFIPHGKRPAGWGQRFSLRCDRCGTERHDVIDARGELSTRQYVYPDDYATDAEHKPTIQDLRLSLLRDKRERTRSRANNRRSA